MKVFKSQIIDQLAYKSNITKKDSRELIDNLLELITDHLKKDNKVEFKNFGSFDLTHLPEMIGRNPKSQQPVKVPARKRIRFTAGEGLRKDVNS